jgi:hypothetical protein
MSQKSSEGEDLLNKIGENPGPGLTALGTLAAGGIGYILFENEISALNNSIAEGFGVDIMRKTFIFDFDGKSGIESKFSGAAGSGNISLTIDNKLTLYFDSKNSLSVSFGLGVNVPLFPNSIKPDIKNMTLNNADQAVFISFKKQW